MRVAFRVFYKARWGMKDSKAYWSEAELKYGIRSIKGYHGRNSIERVELYAAYPIDVTSTYAGGDASSAS